MLTYRRQPRSPFRHFALIAAITLAMAWVAACGSVTQASGPSQAASAPSS
jgi:hypothetical protein